MASPTAIAVVSSWIHEEPHLPQPFLPTDAAGLEELVNDLGVLAAALVRCWAIESGLSAEALLEIIAHGIAVGEISTT